MRVSLTLLFMLFFSQSAQADMLRLCHDVYPPYLLDSGADAPLTGIKVVIAHQAAALSGIDIKIIVTPWKRCLVGAEQGLYDGVLMMDRTPEREKGFLFSDPVYAAKSVFLYRQARFPSGLHWTNLADISHYSLGMVIGDHIDDAMEQEFQKVQPIFRVRDFFGLLSFLAAGRVDLVAMDGLAARHMVQARKNDSAITITDQSISSEGEYFALSRTKDHAALLPRLNRAIAIMKRDGTIEAALAAIY